ncbi:hypothetical protein [Pedobacter nyackensis]|uniref:hypothetical protein n=1 Tax=Pedobacter nyackensis TaxID=475255 RepID=UPI001F2E1F03|nr:hypothetical protein [Pedobacter nyackensis]
MTSFLPDFKRWKKGNYINNVKFYNVPLGWLDKYYLGPIPVQEMVLNPQLKQTQGW